MYSLIKKGVKLYWFVFGFKFTFAEYVGLRLVWKDPLLHDRPFHASPECSVRPYTASAQERLTSS